MSAIRSFCGLTLIGALAATMAPSAAMAGRGKPCTSCEQCTEMLAVPGAEVAVEAPLTTGQTCITVRGAGATLDGGRQPIRAGTAVVVEAADVFVRHLRTAGGERGIVVKGPRATLLDVQTADHKVGLIVDDAPEVRVVRSLFEKSAIGVSFSDPPKDACDPSDRLTSPGAVLQKVEIVGNGAGLVACEAAPVVVDSTITGNATGWVQGAAKGPENARFAGAAGPYDPCVCAPTLDGMRPGTTLLYSSGCAGSLHAEGLLPDVTARGHDVLLREYGREASAKTAAYDAYVRRCAPEITDAIGIPGCMPNYACVASGTVAKRRGDDDRLVVDSRIGGADDMAAFAAQCLSIAEARYGGAACPEHAMYGTKLCDNETDLKAARPVTGVGNTCAGGEGLGCAPCGAKAAAPAAPTPTAPAARPPAAPPSPPPAPAAPAPTESSDGIAVDAMKTSPDDAADDTRDEEPRPSTWWFPLVMLPVGAAGGWLLARGGR